MGTNTFLQHFVNQMNCGGIEPCAVSSPKSTDESRDSSIILFNRNPEIEKQVSNGDSPWLSKPRRSELCLSLSETSNTSTSEVKCTPRRNLSFRKQTRKKCVKLGKIKLCLENLNLTVSADQWQLICDYLQVKSDDESVDLDDSVSILIQILGVEMDLKGVLAEELKSHLQFGQVEPKLDKLESENKELCYQIKLLKQLLHEERSDSCETERELYFTRKKIQELINEKRQLKTELAALRLQKDEMVERKNEESQTDLKNSKRKDITCRLYQISTEKLLQFTKVVYDLLTEHMESSASKQAGNSHEKPDMNTARQPIRVKRAASVQNGTGDVSNYFSRKYVGGGRLCRAASVCTVGSNLHLTGSDKTDILERLANKAKEISITIENILSENDASNPTQERVEWV